MLTSAILDTAVADLIDSCPHFHHSIIGTSRLGKPIHAITIGRGARSVLVNATHHANEWITTLILMKFLKECKIDFPLDDVTLHAIPLVNPDGVDIINDDVRRSEFFGKGGESRLWKANICGVDLNSNYPAGWELAREHKFARGYTSPGARDYVGEKPLSEPESCAMAAYTLHHDVDVTLSLHTQGEEIYWRYVDCNPPGAEALARRLSAVSGYKLEEVPDESSHGGYRDWFIQAFNRPGFTIECGLGESPLPISQFDDIYKKVAPLLWESLKAMRPR
ncbi:MAG: M14 family metallocarboxypeptidase [Defluviitaleaceae bacterium]|nr:M14 family metallocarboxypeptidase [Defluviitaleaceae bacterium]